MFKMADSRESGLKSVFLSSLGDPQKYVQESKLINFNEITLL